MSSSKQNNTRSQIQVLGDYLNNHILGQQMLISRMMIAFLCDGHLLVEGAPGLAKTRAVKALAGGLEGEFQRIQFTPDLLPSDLTGTDVYHPQDGSFSFQSGPLFNHIIVADEINRAPAKVQSALLESMEERQITVGGKSYPLPELFFVMATQNPIEHEGTYPLPEAQLDRFLLKINIGYPSIATESKIMQQVRMEALGDCQALQMHSNLPLSQKTIFQARKQILNLHMAEPVEAYITQLVNATRQPALFSDELAGWIQYGASPRASLAFDRCSRALAWLDNRDYVSAEDVQQLAHEIFRHRVLLSYQAELQGITIDRVIDELLCQVAVA